MKDSGHGMQPHFKKKDGGEWGMNAGTTDFSQFKPGNLLVIWNDFIVQSATAQGTTAPAASGSTESRPSKDIAIMVSGVLKSGLEGGHIQKPSDLQEWADAAYKALTQMGNPY